MGKVLQGGIRINFMKKNHYRYITIDKETKVLSFFDYSKQPNDVKEFHEFSNSKREYTYLKHILLNNISSKDLNSHCFDKVPVKPHVISSMLKYWEKYCAEERKQ